MLARILWASLHDRKSHGEAIACSGEASSQVRLAANLTEDMLGILVESGRLDRAKAQND